MPVFEIYKSSTGQTLRIGRWLGICYFCAQSGSIYSRQVKQ